MNQDIISALLLPSAYPEPTDHVELKQTHISYLFLTKDFVYKVKKGVNFGFLDFTTLEQRQHFCEEEVRLNTRLCPGMYLGVAHICLSAGGIKINGPGTVIEYAVKMLRLPADRMLNRMLDAQQVSTPEIREVARRIAEFHCALPTNVDIAQFGEPRAIAENWNDNISQLRSGSIPPNFSADLDRIDTWGQNFLILNDQLLQRRVADGYIRECDGDIHSENICLTDPVRIFDCIEFNSRFRYSDTAADLAFLLMDLDFHRRSDLATVAVDEYTAITGDEACRELLPFYKVYRALIRAKVEALRSMDPECHEGDRRQAAQQALAYLRLARGLTLRPNTPATLFMLCGLMGCGKSTLAEALAYELGCQILRSDLIRKELAGVSPTTTVRTDFRSGLYDPEMTRLTYANMAARAEEALTREQSVIVDASFTDPCYRGEFIAIAQRCRVRCYLLYLAGSDSLHYERLQARTARGNDVSDGRVELFAAQKQSFIPPAAGAGIITLDASETLDNQLQTAYLAIAGTAQ